MKKFLSLFLIFVLVLSFAACGGNGDGGETSGSETSGTETSGTETSGSESSGDTTPVTVMTHAEYMAAELDSPVVIESYVQATQGWWNDDGQGKITVYLQDADGAYLAYELACTEEDAALLTPGTKIRVSGHKGAWNGEIEIMDGTFEFIEGSDTYIASATDVTALLANEAELIKHQNEFVSFKGMTVVSIGKDAEGNDAVYYYNWDNSGAEGNDLYFKVSDGTNSYTFTVESYLTGSDSDVYKAVKELAIGDVIDLEGFLYWYEGVNPHITSVSAAVDVMSHAEYIAAEMDAAVVIEAYVQATQSWWSDNGQGKITAYLQDVDGAYFAYEMACTEADAALLTPGTKIRVSGYKGAWNGEVEIMDGTFEFIEGSDTYIAEATDVTALLANEAELIKHQNEFVAFKGMTVVAIGQDAEGNDAVYYYNWDNSGSEGSDLYFKVSDGTNSYTFTVESYLTGSDSDVYKAIKTLTIGDTIDMEGFLYWYEGVNPHITSVTVIPVE